VKLATWIGGYYVYLDEIVGIEKSDEYDKDKKDWFPILITTRAKHKIKSFCVEELSRYIKEILE
jgi:hypothetical protein